jgi:hypothetical protein
MMWSPRRTSLPGTARRRSQRLVTFDAAMLAHAGDAGDIELLTSL